MRRGTRPDGIAQTFSGANNATGNQIEPPACHHSQITVRYFVMFPNPTHQDMGEDVSKTTAFGRTRGSTNANYQVRTTR